MSNFSALIATIQANIKTNGQEEITGAILQDVLEAMVDALGTEAINNLETALSNEVGNRQNADGTLQTNINNEANTRSVADTALGGRIDGVVASITAINTKLAEGYVYAGIATPSANPSTPTGKVFYIATAAGTYTNFLDSGSAALVVTRGINILKFNGTAWSIDVVIGIDVQPTENSHNLVESGSVYDKTDITRQIDADFGIDDNNGNRIFEINDGGLRTKDINIKPAEGGEFTVNGKFKSKEIPQEAEISNDFAIIDKQGYSILSILNGHLITKNFNSAKKRKIKHIIGYGQSLMAGTYSGAPVSVDEYGNIYKFVGGIRTYDKFGLDANRQTHITRNGQPAYGELFLTPQTSLSAYDYDVLTQSLSDIVLASETRGKYKVNSDQSIADSYVYDESGSYLALNENGETPLTAFCNEYNRQVSGGIDEYKFDYDFLISCAAYGSARYKTLLPLDRGGIIHQEVGSQESNLNYFEVLMSQVVAGKRYADAHNIDYSVDFVFYFEESTDADTYSNPNILAARILQLFSIINMRVRAVTKQRNDIVFVVPSSSLGTNTLQEANALIVNGKGELQLTAAEKTALSGMDNYDVVPYSMDNVIGAVAHYGYPVVSDGIHHSTLGQLEIGTTMGANLANKDINALYPKNIEVVGNNIYVTYDINVSPLVVDTTRVDSQSNYGFLLVDDSNNASNIISSVSIEDPNIIKIVCSSSPVGLNLTYALITRKGNIRDSQTTKIQNTYNWAYSFKYKLND